MRKIISSMFLLGIINYSYGQTNDDRCRVEIIKINAIQRNNYLFNIEKKILYSEIDSIVKKYADLNDVIDYYIPIKIKIRKSGKIKYLKGTTEFCNNDKLVKALEFYIKSFETVNPMWIVNEKNKPVKLISDFEMVIQFCSDGKAYVTFLYQNAWGPSGSMGDKTCPSENK
jgi:hypothetical protein